MTSRCFIKYPYGIATFYGPVVVGVVISWVLFVFIVQVIMTAIKTQAEKTDEADIKMRTVSGYSGHIVAILAILAIVVI